MAKILTFCTNPENAEDLHLLLTRELSGISFVAAKDRHEGIRMVETLRPDLILLDHEDIGTEGMDFALSVRQRNPSNPVPIICLVPGHMNGSVRTTAHNAGINAVLGKPVGGDALAKLIDSYLKIRQIEEALVQQKKELDELMSRKSADHAGEVRHRDPADKNRSAHEERFRMIVKNSSDILVVVDPEGYQRYISPAALTITGYSPAELTGKHFSEVIHPDDLPGVISSWRKNRGKMQGTIRIRFRHINKERQWVALEAVGHSYLNEPSIQGFILSVREITEFVKVEQASRRAAAIHQMQLNIANAVLHANKPQELYEIIHKEIGQVIEARNFFVARFDEISGLITPVYKRDEFDAIPSAWSMENSLTGFVIRHKRSLIVQKDDILALAESGEIVLRGRRAEVWIGIPLKSGDDVVAAMVLQSYDQPGLYDKSTVELLENVAGQLSIFFEKNKAREGENRFGQVMAQSPVSIIITDLKGVIEYVNPKTCEITGYTDEELTGRNARILQSGMTPTETYKGLWETITIGGEWRGELQNKKKDGSLYWESVTITPVFDNSGRMTNYIAVKEDITEQKSNIALLEEAKQRAEAGDRLKSAFLENISHEIRTPLNGILGFAPMVLDPGITLEEKEEYLYILNASGKRLMQTITDYMDISMLVSGNMKVCLREFLVGDILEETKDHFALRIDQKKLGFRIIPDPVIKNPKLKTDPDLIRKVLFHLVDNAIKFTEKGEIVLEYQVCQEQLQMRIIDAGIGIDREIIPNIFEKFFQVDHYRTRNFEGSGLGLTIVSEIMKLIGGTVQVTSKKWAGSTFTIRLPLELNLPEN